MEQLEPTGSFVVEVRETRPMEQQQPMQCIQKQKQPNQHLQNTRERKEQYCKDLQGCGLVCTTATGGQPNQLSVAAFQPMHVLIRKCGSRHAAGRGGHHGGWGPTARAGSCDGLVRSGKLPHMCTRIAARGRVVEGCVLAFACRIHVANSPCTRWRPSIHIHPPQVCTAADAVLWCAVLCCAGRPTPPWLARGARPHFRRRAEAACGRALPELCTGSSMFLVMTRGTFPPSWPTRPRVVKHTYAVTPDMCTQHSCQAF
jgi:hypothetical protein